MNFIKASCLPTRHGWNAFIYQVFRCIAITNKAFAASINAKLAGPFFSSFPELLRRYIRCILLALLPLLSYTFHLVPTCVPSFPAHLLHFLHLDISGF